MTRVAVALAAWNGERYLREQVESILAQEDVAVSIFVSVDTSTDGTCALAAELAESDTRVGVLPPAGRFGGAAPNFLRLLRDIDLGGFDALAFADQDDIWYPRKLARAVGEMARTGTGGYSSNVIAFWPSGRELLIDKAQPQRRWDHLFEAAGPGCTYVLSQKTALALQARVLQDATLLSPLEYHDWLAYAFARTNGFGWTIDAKPGMAYRQHAHNQIGVNSGWAPFARRARRVLAGHAFAQARLVARVVGAQDTAPAQLLQRGRVGLLLLALRARQCRRSARDQLFFFVMCIVMAMTRGSSPGVEANTHE